ncbi:hypothetical protein ABPG77_003681 [Micractinium sp. CCAP 211/92]
MKVRRLGPAPGPAGLGVLLCLFMCCGTSLGGGCGGGSPPSQATVYLTDLVDTAFATDPSISSSSFYYLIFNGSAGAVVNSITVDLWCFISTCSYALDVLDTDADGAFFRPSTSLNLTIPNITAGSGRVTFAVQDACGSGWVLPSSGPFAVKVFETRGFLMYWPYDYYNDTPFNTTNGFSYVNWAYEQSGNFTYGTQNHRQIEIAYMPRPPPPHRPPPPRRPPPPPPVVKEGGAFSDGAGLHFTGFNGEPVPVSPKAGIWLEVVGSSAQSFTLQAQFGASTDNPKTLVARATSLQVGNNTIVVRVALSGTSKQWELSAAANGKAVTGTATLAGGVKVGLVRFDPPSNLVASRATVDAGFARLVVTQRWDPKASRPQDSVNFGVTLVGPLKPPVSGALKASYAAAFRRA